MRAKDARTIRSGIETARTGGDHAVAMLFGNVHIPLWARAYSKTMRTSRVCPNCRTRIIRASDAMHPDSPERYRAHIKECWA